MGQQVDEAGVVQVVVRPATLAAQAHDARLAQDPQLLGDRVRRQARVRCELLDRALSVEQGVEDAQAAAGREDRHGLGEDLGLLGVERAPRGGVLEGMGHAGSMNTCVHLCIRAPEWIRRVPHMITTGASPAVITCPIIGGFPSNNPNHPRTLADIVRHGIDAARAGAAALHIHARTADGEVSQDAAVYEEIGAAIRAEVPDVILNYTTGGSVGMSEDDRLGSVAALPDLASLDCGTMNFGDGIFVNTPAFIERCASEMRAAGVKPELECFEAGMVATGVRLLAEGKIDAPALFQMVLGVRGGAPARVDTLVSLVGLLPPGTVWAAAAIGPPHFPIMAAALGMGGHIRSGMEDVAYTARGEFATSNAQLVERAAALCAAIGRPVATPAQTREILHLDQ